MNHSQFLNLMDDLLELEQGTLQGNELLKDLNDWNSLAVISFMALVNERCGLILQPRDISACVKVDDLWNLTAV